MNRTKKIEGKALTTESYPCLYAFAVTFLRIILFPLKIMGIFLLIILLIVYLTLMLSVAMLLCIWFVLSQECLDAYTKVARMGQKLVDAIQDLW